MDEPFSGEKNFVTMNNRPTIKQTDKTEHRAKTAHQSHHGSSISFEKSWKIICLAHQIQQPIPNLEFWCCRMRFGCKMQLLFWILMNIFAWNTEICKFVQFLRRFHIAMHLQVNGYEIVENFFHISHNLTWYSAIVHKVTRIYPVCSTYELTKQFM
jgi:hypothetical protein